MDQRIRRFDRCQLSMARICTPQTVPPNRLGRVLKTSCCRVALHIILNVRTYERTNQGAYTESGEMSGFEQKGVK